MLIIRCLTEEIVKKVHEIWVGKRVDGTVNIFLDGNKLDREGKSQPDSRSLYESRFAYHFTVGLLGERAIVSVDPTLTRFKVISLTSLYLL